MIQKRIKYFKTQRQNRLDGKYNGIPLFKAFNRFGKYLPAIPKGTEVLLTASSGVGKSHSWLGIILYPMYKVIKEGGFKAKFLIILLEDPKEMFIDRLFSRVLKDKFNIEVDPMQLSSYKENPLSEDIIHKLEQVSTIVEDILSYCEIIDNIYNATGCYKWCRDKSNEYGTHHTKAKTINGKKVQLYSHYKYDDPDLHVIVIKDNLNNESEELGKTLHQCIGLWCREYCRKQMVKHWKFIIINIIQQASDTEKQQYTLRGNSIVNKVKPSLAGLGDNKMIARDHHIILGLFAPDRYEIEEYQGYDISKLRDNVRFLSILKSNIGIANVEIPLYFNGACSLYKELPKPDNMTETIYNRIQRGEVQ